ncbi:hypothetical protein L6452_08732 [Arctium lappa]|uniref:Uncharacterized protein n=1 Tax=Arctium lappa TaxID=4217 RepID=A0ACB9DIQ1_ARCLA|nr:hypothetical protein L6452_08732 [Arctium lappa]
MLLERGLKRCWNGARIWGLNGAGKWPKTVLERGWNLGLNSAGTWLEIDRERCKNVAQTELDQPYAVINENPQFRREPVPVRVDKIFELIKQKLPDGWYQLLAFYGVLKKYVGGVKGSDNNQWNGASHGSPGRADVPSIVAVVGSRNWPLVSRYRASVRTQSARVEMIYGLFKPVSNYKDEGMIRIQVLQFALEHVEDKKMETLLEGLLEVPEELRLLLSKSIDRLNDFLFSDNALDSIVRTKDKHGKEL